MGWRSKRCPFRWSEDDPFWRCWSGEMSKEVLLVVALAKEKNFDQNAPSAFEFEMRCGPRMNRR